MCLFVRTPDFYSSILYYSFGTGHSIYLHIEYYSMYIVYKLQ